MKSAIPPPNKQINKILKPPAARTHTKATSQMLGMGS